MKHYKRACTVVSLQDGYLWIRLVGLQPAGIVLCEGSLWSYMDTVRG